MPCTDCRGEHASEQERSLIPLEVGRRGACGEFVSPAWEIHHTSWVAFPADPLYEIHAALAGREQ